MTKQQQIEKLLSKRQELYNLVNCLIQGDGWNGPQTDVSKEEKEIEQTNIKLKELGYKED